MGKVRRVVGEEKGSGKREENRKWVDKWSCEKRVIFIRDT